MTTTPTTNSTPPNGGDAMAQATAAWQAGQLERVVAVLGPVAAAPDAPLQALQLLAAALTRLGRLEEAVDCHQRVLAAAPTDVAGWVNLAGAQTALGRIAASLESLDQAQRLDPAQPAVHFNRGNALMRGGQHEAALASFRRAAELAPDRPDPLCNQASALHAMLRYGEALELLRQVVARFPTVAQGWNLLGQTFHKLDDDQQALGCYEHALQCDAKLLEAYTNSAQVLARMGRLDDALAVARYAYELAPGSVTTARTLGSVFVGRKDDEAARPWLEQALQRAPQDPVALAQLFDLDSKYCDWQAAEQRLAALRQLWQAGVAVDGVGAWRLLSHPLGPQELRDFTARQYGRRYAALANEGTGVRWARPRQRPQRLRIGYFSSDLQQHPVGVLVAGMLEQHDRSRFETFAFCLAPGEAEPVDALRPRLRAAFDHFERVRHMGDAELVERARSLRIDIAIDLNGHTENGRPGAFVRRLAPVQMHYLGYAGTLGLPGAIDYLVADRVVVPADARGLYHEKILELPESFQANDDQRRIDPHVPSREALQLPRDAFVFCCFNKPYKIGREVFTLWMELLRQRPGSVLWLQSADERVVHNLRTAAAALGVDADRLVFAQRTARIDQHLARHARADLFLDTWPYNAHTTASDALWAGLPVLTCSGETFASRVGASLLQACGLPELVTHSPQEYLERALQLSSQPAALQALRRRLLATRQERPLFDTQRFTRHMEQGYDMAWERFSQGLPPDHLSVPPRS